MEPNHDLKKTIEEHILRLLGQENLRLSPRDLVQKLKKQFPGIDHRQMRSSIQGLVEAGRLTYSHHFNSSQLELNSRGRVEVSERIVLNSNFYHKGRSTDPMEITMQAGSSFGCGDHPTTLLSLKALDLISKKMINEKKGRRTMCLDIGTGTGVLAIAAVKLGVARAVALDIDPLACHEAIRNVSLNRLTSKVFVVAGYLDATKSFPYDLIAANLRPATLARLLPEMAFNTRSSGYWILSGCRPEEMETLQTQLPNGFKTIWQECNRNWAAFAVQRFK